MPQKQPQSFPVELKSCTMQSPEPSVQVGVPWFSWGHHGHELLLSKNGNQISWILNSEVRAELRVERVGDPQHVPMELKNGAM